ncbi:dTMP kinase [Acuticoccus sp. MNP-M23]|uniref:dTMP kinase n=1 Tax=Acuticoccus sp. MNP-M23 TaxID=3072793 RepID=UPI0028153BE4|nr:dTMP kinase [Acuticoccus sp. MNP-M23]WMS42192.1 dTMP kinase [Acuticoccus sp. MNP-M23]
MPIRGKFISLEGGEGAGKSTQARALAQKLRARGKDVLMTREPGGSPWAERLRSALLSDAGQALSPAEQTVMFAAARADHVDTVIEPALAEGRWVVCDRFADSTEAYQGSAGASTEMMALLRAVAAGDLAPDLTFILDLPPEVGRERAEQRDTLDGFEKDTMEVQGRRRNAFLQIAAREPARCVVVDATISQDEVAEAMWRVVHERLLPTLTVA